MITCNFYIGTNIGKFCCLSSDPEDGGTVCVGRAAQNFLNFPLYYLFYYG